MAQSNRWTKTGQVLVEILLAIGLAAILLPALLTGLISSRQGKAQQQQRTQATALLTEAVEATRSVREKGWTTFAVNGIYHPVISGSTWTLDPDIETISGFTRSVVVSDFLRNGSLDPSTKKVDVTVNWNTPLSSTVSATIYLTRYLDNLLYTQDTEAEFKTGISGILGTNVTNTSGGEVTLGAGGQGNWCNPSLSVTNVDLSRQGVPTAISAYPGNVITGTGGNASGPTFVKTTVAGNNPPIATIQGQFNNSKANGVFTESTYGYIASTDTHQEIKILNLSTPSGNPPLYSVIGWFDAPGTGNIDNDSIYVVNSVGYMTREDKFYTFSLGSGDLAGRSGSRPQLNTDNNAVPTLSGMAKKIVVVGNYAYVVTDSTTTQLQIINVEDPAHPTIKATASMGNNMAGVDVTVNATGTRAYVVTNYAPGKPDFFIIDTTSHSGSLSPLGTGFNTAGMTPKGVAVVTGNRAIIVGTGGSYQYQVVNIDIENSPTICLFEGNSAGLVISGGAYGVASVLQNDYAYSYVVTGDTHAELKIILGGSGGQYASSGTYESAFFDPGYSTAFNRLDVTYTKPANTNITNITFQVAIADPVSGSCANANYVFVGPDATSATFFNDDGVIPLNDDGVGYENPARCFKYRAYLSTSDFSSTPILEQVIVNYSP